MTYGNTTAHHPTQHHQTMSKHYYTNPFFLTPNQELPDAQAQPDYTLAWTVTTPPMKALIVHENHTPVMVYYKEAKHLAQVQFFHRDHYPHLPLGLLSLSKQTAVVLTYDAAFDYTGREVLHFDQQHRLHQHSVFNASHQLISYKEFWHATTTDSPEGHVKVFDGKKWSISTLPL